MIETHPETASDAVDQICDRIFVVYATNAAGLQENVNGFLRANPGVRIVNMIQSQNSSPSGSCADPVVHVFLTIHYQIKQSASGAPPVKPDRASGNT
jgi:hypothetical protein